MQVHSTRILVLALAAAALIAAPASAARRRAHAPVHRAVVHAAPAPVAPGPLTLTSVRCWSAPSNTRVVFDFSAPVTLVAPDSGSAPQLVITVPQAELAISPDVARVLAVRDSAVDSVLTVVDSNGAHLSLFLYPGTNFKVFTLSAGEDKTYRVVVDVVRPGGQAAEDRQIGRAHV